MSIEENPTLEKSSPHECLKRTRQWRAAVAQQILTPSFDRAGVTWKLRAAKDAYLPISQEEIKDAIEADEAFLSAHPVKQSRKSKARAVA